MRRNGFRYFAMKIEVSGFRRPSSDLPSPGQLEESGYGITANMAGSLPSLGLSGRPDSRLLQYMESLSPTDQRAFYSALFGPELADQASDGRPVGVVSGVGCAGEALVSGSSAPEKLRATLQANWAETEAAFRSDGRVVALQLEWSSCMTKQGFRYRDRYEAVNELMERSVNAMSTGGTASDEFIKLADDEYRISTADAKCLKGDYDELLRIQNSYEETFRASFAKELETAARLLE
jgi:hypothetical protein